MKLRVTKPRVEERAEYTVEFQAVSTFLVGFTEAVGLTDRQVMEKAIALANDTFQRGGCWVTERATADGFTTFTALGIDRSSGHILGRPAQDRPRLKIVKNPSRA